MVDFQEPDREFIERWLRAATTVEIPVDAYVPKVRVVSDSSGRSDYTFGVIFNENRARRPLDTLINKLDCPLCDAVEDAQEDSVRNLDPDFTLAHHIVVANIFPTMLGHSLAVSDRTRDNEITMYDSSNLIALPQELERLFSYTDSVGLQAFRNGKGAGSSVPNHEHTHLTNWHATFSAAGQVYGFEAAEVTYTPVVDVREISDFPFAHLVFRQDEPDRIADFLSKLSWDIGQRYDQGAVPFIIAQGQLGVLVAPYKNHMDGGGIGSGDVAGHIVFKDRAEYDSATYQTCVDRLDKQLFRKEDIDLVSYL